VCFSGTQAHWDTGAYPEEHNLGSAMRYAASRRVAAASTHQKTWLMVRIKVRVRIRVILRLALLLEHKAHLDEQFLHVH